MKKLVLKIVLGLGLLSTSLMAEDNNLENSLLNNSINIVKNVVKNNVKSIDLGFKSHHFQKNKDYKYNELNLGIFLNLKNNISLGYIHENSYKNKSIVLGYNFDIYKKGDFELTIKPFFSTGYKGTANNSDYIMKTNVYAKKFGGLMPGVGVSVSYKNFKVSFNPNPFNIQNSIVYFGLNLPIENLIK